MSLSLNETRQELRTVGNSPLVIFIVYTVGEEAEKNGYWEWLERVDSPFFNAIPGVRRYENWIVEQNLAGEKLEWDYFDFQGIDSEESLEPVWFNPDLDGFRKEWIRLWGYGSKEPSPILRHAYILRPVVKLRPGVETDHLVMTAGRGEPPSEGDGVFRVEAVLSKHFATGGQRAEGWVKPAADFNPLGFEWLSVTYEKTGGEHASTNVAATEPELTRLTARRIA
jgi:hypothetical protein